jgi:hypothetical protein
METHWEPFGNKEEQRASLYGSAQRVLYLNKNYVVYLNIELYHYIV